MPNKSTEYSIQQLKNLSADFTVSPPIPREGLLGKDGTNVWRNISVDTNGVLSSGAIPTYGRNS